MPRFYCPQALTAGATVDLPEALAHHARVLRLQAGAPLTLFDGAGCEATASLETLDKRSATARILAAGMVSRELPFAVTLAQALPEAAKMDWIIEKAVELGVAAIAPLAAQRCVVRLSGERAEKRQAHWQGVIVAACEQSGRNTLARLDAVTPLATWLAQRSGQARLLLSPRASLSLAAWAQSQPPGDLSLMVGPEGGFTEQEEAQALAAGVLAVSMGPRILRTETAALAALSVLSAHWGGMQG